MPRIIAGEYGGRKLKYPPSPRFRPTMDKVKQAMFSMLADEMQDARVLDLFCAAGGLGLEALSRGALQAVFVEQNPQAAADLEANIKALDVKDITIVVKQDVRVYLKQSKLTATHIFLDPPYRSNLCQETLRLLATNPGFTDDTRIICEHSASTDLEIPPHLEVLKEKTFGETRLSILGRKPQ